MKVKFRDLKSLLVSPKILQISCSIVLDECRADGSRRSLGVGIVSLSW